MIILDTNVVSACMRPAKNKAVIGWLDSQPPESLWTTTVTLFELRDGIERLVDGDQLRAEIEKAWEEIGSVIFENRILQFDIRAARAAAGLAGMRQKEAPQRGLSRHLHRWNCAVTAGNDRHTQYCGFRGCRRSACRSVEGIMIHLMCLNQNHLQNLSAPEVVSRIKLISTISVQMLLDRDPDLIVIGAHEQATCHRLAVYLEQYTDLNVDCEYNRSGPSTKEISTGNIKTDILIHRRLNHLFNALALEMKFTTNSNKHDDITRLKELVDANRTFRYRLGAFIEIDNSAVRSKSEPEIAAQISWITPDGEIEPNKLLTKKLNPELIDKLGIPRIGSLQRT